MVKDSFDDIIRRSLEIRKKYHELEMTHHGSEWTVEEDALAYLTDAGDLAEYHVGATANCTNLTYCR